IEERDGEILYNVTQDYKEQQAKITSDDVLHFRYMTLDGYIGYSPLYALSNEVGISQGSKKFLRDFFDNGGTSTSVLKYSKGIIKEEQLIQIKDNFSKSQSNKHDRLMAF